MVTLSHSRCCRNEVWGNEREGRRDWRLLLCRETRASLPAEQGLTPTQRQPTSQLKYSMPVSSSQPRHRPISTAFFPQSQATKVSNTAKHNQSGRLNAKSTLRGKACLLSSCHFHHYSRQRKRFLMKENTAGQLARPALGHEPTQEHGSTLVLFCLWCLVSLAFGTRR